MSRDRRSSSGYVDFPLVPTWMRLLVVLAAVGGLVYYSVMPAPGTGSISYGPLGLFSYSVWLHFVGYMGLALTLAYATCDSSRPRWQVLVGVFVFTVGCGAAVEVVQYTLPTRTFSLLDIAVNAVGASVGVALWAIVDRVVRFDRVEL